MRWIRRLPKGTLATAMAIGACASVAVLSWFGYRAIVEWRQSAVLLADRRASEAADLLIEALTRDMRGVQESIRSAAQWDRFVSDGPYEMSIPVATTFARYPYPESFFAWTDDRDLDELVLFNRSDRRPPWTATDPGRSRFPVVIESAPLISRTILTRVMEDVAVGRRLSAFEVSLNDTRYQVVASLKYRDVFRERVSEVVGFTVNLHWVEDHYFAELTNQVKEIGGGAGLTFAVIDGTGRRVAGATPGDDVTTTIRRPFSLVFFDPDMMLDMPADLGRQRWVVEVSAAGDEALSKAISGSNRMLMIGATAAFVLAIGVMMTARAERASAKLSELRSDFVSTVTHELKTPIATIRAAAETLSSGRLQNIESVHSYGRLVVGQAKRLSRLVENMLAYARITDVADVYAFEPIEVESLLSEVQNEFQRLPSEARFEIEVDVPLGVPAIRGDRLALRLLLDNLVDNAMKYSDKKRWVLLRARMAGSLVAIDVEDAGIGIAPEEITQVMQKFVRGRHAPSSGSGLGLAIVARITQDHGGTLQIHSKVGVGTTVAVTFQPAGVANLDIVPAVEADRRYTLRHQDS